ncbi:MAG: Hpt domain-containing protein [Alphaproteobacteria bacterium]|nr:Hpt domain-containing protein [Alphaproteobacteria bacterium]
MSADPMTELDAAALDEVRELDPDDSKGVLGSIITTYLTTSSDLMAKLQEAARSDDAAEAMRASHTLKSSSGFLGATAFADLCREIEHLSRAGDLAAVRPQIAAAVAAHPRLCAALKELIRQPAAA